MKVFVGIKAKTSIYVKDNNNEDKKAKSCAILRKRKFQDCKNCLEAAQNENKTNLLEQNKINLNSFKEDQKEFIKNNKLILKT